MDTAVTEPRRDASGEATATAARRRFGYKPALDGMRAVAVLAVIAYHYEPSWAPGGFLGVDMFFVLSGYLITSLLLVEMDATHAVNFGAFWSRRVRRLLPALLLVLVAVSLWGHSHPAPTLRGDLLWTLFYGANWRFIATDGSYFMLRHMWSLAIEEQFYLVWPLVVFACVRLARGRHRLLAAVCVVGTGLSVWSLVARYDPSRPARAFYATDARAGELLVGALLGIVLLGWAPRRSAERTALQVLGFVAAAGIAVAFARAKYPSDAIFHGGFLAFALATAVVVAAVVQPSGAVLARPLSWAPVRWVGQISYGLYLWHYPMAFVLDGDRVGVSGHVLTLVRLAATFTVATLSYYLVERPIRRHRFVHQWTGLVLLLVAVLATIAVILAATA